MIGLVGAVSNNGKTENTDRVVAEALAAEDSEETLQRIHEEKFRIAPDCATCLTPCGNTSDFDMDRFDAGSEKIISLKQELIHTLQEYVLQTNALQTGVLQDCSSSNSFELSDTVYQSIAYLGYDMEEDAYRELIDELRQEREKSTELP